MKKKEVRKTMKELDKKIKENTTWNKVDPDEFIGQFRGVEDIHQAEAKRLIEVFLGRSIKDNESFIRLNPKPFKLAFKKAKENALKCCNEIIKELELIKDDGWSNNSLLIKRYDHYKSVKQAIKDYNHE